jgi:hypothetical protein
MEEEMTNVDYASALKKNMNESIELTPESGEAYDRINDVFVDVPDGKVGFVNLKTGDVKVLGDIDQQVASVLYEETQHDAGSGGTSHIIKYSTIYDMINAEPSINFGLTLHGELPVAYGYRFQQAASVKELNKLQTINQISDEYWAEWAKYVNLDHILKMAIHSLKAMGVVYIEKTYDAAGMNKKGWGIRKMRILSPDAMYVVVDSKGNILGFIQWAGETDRKFYEDDEQAKKLVQQRRIRISDQSKFLKQHPGAISIPRHKIIFATYNAYYDDTVYGYGNLIPLIPYSKSKIGIQQRVLRMIENSASSFVVFKYGTENYMVSGKAATKVMTDITKAKNPKYIVVPFYFDVQPIDMGGAIQTVAPVMDYFKDEQLTGLSVPMILLRPGGSGEGASVQLEAFTRQLKYMQNIMSNILRTQCFPEALLGDPIKSSKLVTDDVRLYPYIRPSVYHKIPELKWNVIETVADRRLRLETDAQYGGIGLTEYRQDIGRTGKVPKSDEMPLIQIQREQMEVDKELQEQTMEHEKQMADMEMKKMDKEMKKADQDVANGRLKLDMDKEKFDLDKQKNKEKERTQSVKDRASFKKKPKSAPKR